MNILVDFQDTIGGAPRSLLEHTKLLIDCGHKITVVISEKNSELFFKSIKKKPMYLSRFNKKSLLKNTQLIRKYLKIIREEEIDLIYTNRVTQSLFLSIVSDFARTPIINARAGGRATSSMIKNHKDKHYILFSEENLEAFKCAGFSEDMLFLLRNRIPLPTLKKTSTIKSSNELIITITGNIKKDTINGVLWFLSLVNEHAKEQTFSYIINIAGEVLLKAEKEKTLLVKALTETRNRLPENFKVNHLGWVENITNLQGQSNICIGKGRSVIQPAMMGKVTFVLSEEGNLYRCKEDNYNDLLFYNFSGRGEIRENNSSVKEFIGLITKQSAYDKFVKQAEILAPRFIADYSSDYANERLNEIVHYVKENQIIKRGSLNGFKKLFHLYWLSAIKHVRRS